MAIEKGTDLSFLLEEMPAEEELAYYHSLDISAAVWNRLKELGMSQADLARKMGVDKSVITRIIHGNLNMTLKTLAKLEVALDFRLDAGFTYRPQQSATKPASVHALEQQESSEPVAAMA